MLSRSIAWLSANRPVAASAPERASRSSTRSWRVRRRAVGGAHRRTSERRSPAPATPRPRPPRAGRRRRRVARAGRVLDVVRARRCGRAPFRERGGGALVSAEPPAPGRGLVDRAADERMAEAEPPGHFRRADEVEREQLVERVDRGRLGHARCRRGEVGIERVTGDCGALQHAASSGREQRELLGERRHHRARNVDAADRELLRRRHPVAPRCASARAARGRTDCRRSPRTGPPPGRARRLRPAARRPRRS